VSLCRSGVRARVKHIIPSSRHAFFPSVELCIPRARPKNGMDYALPVAFLALLIVVGVKRGMVFGLNAASLTLPLAALSAVGLMAYAAYVAYPRKESVLLGTSRLVIPVWIRLRGVEGARHIVVLGATGTGKTETVKKIIAKQPSALVFDWAGEYDVEPTVKPEELSLSGLTVEEIVEAISNAFQLTTPQSGFLYNVLKNVEIKDLKTIIQRLQNLPESSLSAPEREIRAALLRRLTPCEKLFAGNKELSRGRVDLSSLPHDGKTLTLNVALRIIYNLARRHAPPAKVVVVEEAQNIIPARREGPPSSGELLLQEMRKYGVSVVLSAQFPSTLSEYYRDAEYVIVHRLPVNSDEYRDLSVLLEEEDFQRLTKAKPGEALVLHRGTKKWVRVMRAKIRVKRSKVEKAESVASKQQPKQEEATLEERLNSVASELSKKVEAVAQSLEELRNDLNTLFQMYADLQGEVEGLKPLKGLGKRLEAVEGFKEGLEKLMKERAEQAVQKSEEVAKLGERVKEVESKLTGYEKNLKILLESVPNAFKKLKEVEAGLEALEATASTLKETYSEDVKKLQGRLGDVEANVEALKETLTKQYEELVKRVEGLTARVSDLEARLQKPRKRSASSPIRVDVSNVEATLEKEFPALFRDPPALIVADQGSEITISPQRYLGTEAFKRISGIVKAFGGSVEQDDKGYYWTIPKR